jgi:hypothetical protein
VRPEQNGNALIESWWVSGNIQEGCALKAANQPALIEAIGKSLSAKGLTGTTISAPDETNIDTTIGSVNGYPGTTLAYMSQINTHSYSGSNRSGLKSLA